MNRLLELRKTFHMTQVDMANKLGISRQAYSNYELGYREPDFATLVKLSEIFSVPADFLLTDEVTWHPSVYDDYKKEKTDVIRYKILKSYGVPTKLRSDWFRLKAKFEYGEDEYKLLIKNTKYISFPLLEKEVKLIQKYRDNPQMQPAIDVILGLEPEKDASFDELPVAARSGKIGKVTPTASVEEQDAALEREFPGIFDETE